MCRYTFQFPRQFNADLTCHANSWNWSNKIGAWIKCNKGTAWGLPYPNILLSEYYVAQTKCLNAGNVNGRQMFRCCAKHRILVGKTRPLEHVQELTSSHGNDLQSNIQNCCFLCWNFNFSLQLENYTRSFTFRSFCFLRARCSVFCISSLHRCTICLLHND